MIRVFSFVGSCAGDASHTKELSDRLAAALRTATAARGAELSYECVTAYELRIAFCQSCNECFASGTCPLDGQDDVGTLKQRLLEADIVLFGTPVYLTDISGATRCVLDRISFWAHRLELSGKAGMALVTASGNHGPQVEQRLRELLQYTGLAMPEGLVLQLHAAPHLGVPEESDPAIEAAAQRLLGAWNDPASVATEIQEQLWKGLALHARRALVQHYLRGSELGEEDRVLGKRHVDSYDSFAGYLRALRAGRSDRP